MLLMELLSEDEEELSKLEVDARRDVAELEEGFGELGRDEREEERPVLEVA